MYFFYFSQLKLNQFLYFQVLEKQGIIRVESNALLNGNTIFVFLLISEEDCAIHKFRNLFQIASCGLLRAGFGWQASRKGYQHAAGLRHGSWHAGAEWWGRMGGQIQGLPWSWHWALSPFVSCNSLSWVQGFGCRKHWQTKQRFTWEASEPTVRWQWQSYLFQTSVYQEKHFVICHLLYRQAILCTFFKHPWNNCFLFSDTIISVLLTLWLRASHRQKCQKQRGITQLDFLLDMRPEPTTQYLGLFPKLRFCFLFLTHSFAYPKSLFTLAERIGTHENARFLSILHLFTSPYLATLIN